MALMKLIDDPRDLLRARATFDLFQTAEDIMRQNLRLRFPGESEAEIERRLVSWLRKDPRPRTKQAGQAK